MKRTAISIVVVMFGLLMTWVSCATKKMPEAQLVSVRYTHSGTMAGYIFEGEMKTEKNGDVVLHAMKESYGAVFEKHLTAEQVQHFREIIEEEKMYAYKGRYVPPMEVLDGESWGFSARFADGSSIYTSGSNAWPKGNGLGRIQSYMIELVQDGVLIKEKEFGE